MTFAEFHNALRVLTSIDRHELEDAGVIEVPRGHGVYPGCMDEPNRLWHQFNMDPFRFLIRADDDQAAKIWAVVMSRMGSAPTAHTSTD